MNQDEKIARLIWSESLQKSTKPLTWGLNFESVQAIEAGTKFHVQRIIPAWISIECRDGLRMFRVSVQPDTYPTPITYENVLLHNVVPTIERVLTKTANYEKQECRTMPLVMERMAV